MMTTFNRTNRPQPPQWPPGSQFIWNQQSDNPSDVMSVDLVAGARAKSSTNTHKKCQASKLRQSLPGLATIPTTLATRHTRAKFKDPRRRAQVAHIRKAGACMRCRWNKIPVRFKWARNLSALILIQSRP